MVSSKIALTKRHLLNKSSAFQIYHDSVTQEDS